MDYDLRTVKKGNITTNLAILQVFVTVYIFDQSKILVFFFFYNSMKIRLRDAL